MALRVKNGWQVVMLAMLAGTGACARQEAEPPAGAVAGVERPDVSVTRWTDRTELFAEFPALTVGEPSRFAVHLTQLNGFKALGAGRVEIRLRDDAGQVEAFAVDGPSRPGIFGVTVTPARAGIRDLVIALRSPGLDDEHLVGRVEVFPDVAAAAAAPTADEDPGISFLKEQQWTLEFGTTLAEDRSVQATASVPARIEARPGGLADVSAPIDGRVIGLADLTVGASVWAGQELLRLLPRAAVPGDLPDLRRMQAESEVVLSAAVRDRERAERLVTAGAAPARRLEEATAAERQARARAEAATAALAQYDLARTGGVSESDGAFVVRAPIAGVVLGRDAALGANVRQGEALFHLADTASVHVTGQIPEHDAPGLVDAVAGEIALPGTAASERLTRRVSVGPRVDPEARTVAITFAFDNRRAGLPLGQNLVLHLLRRAGDAGPAVPGSAVVDDAGRPIVFVQRSGETFERRAVTLGASSAGWVRVLDGVATGERVVSTGAHLVRLASLSTSVPAHGHVH